MSEIQHLFDVFHDDRLSRKDLLGRLRARLVQNASLDIEISACLDRELAAGKLTQAQVDIFVKELDLSNPSRRPVRIEGLTFPEESTILNSPKDSPAQKDIGTLIRDVEPVDPDQTVQRVASDAPKQSSDSANGVKRRAIGVGTTIDNKFIVEEELGKGGMGVVYRVLDLVAHKAKDPDPYIALKMLTEEFRRHPQSTIALQRETKKARALQHDNIVGVYSFAEDENKDVYMTMELLDGQTVRDVVSSYEAGSLPLVQAIKMIEEMAAALAYSHSHNVVHADFKPLNVFFTSEEKIKVLDFGLGSAVAQVLPNEAFDSFDLGALTLDYASMEMLQGERPVPADDVFALGLVAFELLTGRHPFDAMRADKANTSGVSVPDVPRVNRRQRRAIAKALSWERADRQADAGEFLREFRGPTPVRKSIYAGLATLAIACVALIITNLLPESPEIAYQDLPPASRQQFDELIELGDTFAERSVYQSAYDAYLKAYLVSEREPIVVDRLESLFTRLSEPADELSGPVAENLWCKVDCLQQNFELFRNNWKLRSSRARIEKGLGAHQIQDPKCGRCPDYRKLARVPAR